MNEELKAGVSILLVCAIAGAGLSLGSYTMAAIWTVTKNTWKKRNAAADLAAAEKIIDGWRKMPNRDSRGRFANKVTR